MKNLILIMLLIITMFAQENKQEDLSLMQSSFSYVLQEYMSVKPQKSFRLQVRELFVENDYARVEAVIVYEDGKLVETDYIEDIVFVLCLERTNNKWQVVFDLSRTDVPSNEEMMEIKKSFPKKFPLNLLSPFWQDLFNRVRKEFTNSIGMKFVKIPKGEFLMGSKEYSYAKPVHKVQLSSYFMMTTEVTQKQWEKIMGSNPSFFRSKKLKYDTSNNPVENISWQDAKEFIKKLNKLENTSRYALPSEAQWEYAAKAGTLSKWSFGDNILELRKYAWYDKNSEESTHPVALKKPNQWGLYDMYGNVSEWCEDDYVSNYKKALSNGKPFLNEKNENKVQKGGDWISYGKNTQSSNRFYSFRLFKFNNDGFRVVFK